jgi:hypothetical protein
LDEETAKRIAEQDALLQARLAAARGRRVDPHDAAERRAVWQRVRRARRAATVCAKCERAIEEGEPVYIARMRLRWGVLRALQCMDCAPVYIPTWIKRDGFGRTCETCGRRVAFDYDEPRLLDDADPPPDPPPGWRRAFCSEVCAYRFHNRVRDERAAAARAGRSCEQCGETFDATRSDQRYCSPACKQRAYRERRQRN